MQAKNIIKNVMVESIKGEPRAAPAPISAPFSILPVKKPPTIATKGTIVSGSAVPIAAKTEPTAHSPIFKTLPKCSIAFVKRVQENSIKRKNIVDTTIWNATSIYISTVSKILITFGWILALEHLFLNSSISTSIGGKVL